MSLRKIANKASELARERVQVLIFFWPHLVAKNYPDDTPFFRTISLVSPEQLLTTNWGKKKLLTCFFPFSGFFFFLASVFSIFFVCFFLEREVREQLHRNEHATSG